MGGSLGGSKSGSSSSSSQNVWGGQSDYLQQLYQAAMNNLGNNDYINQIGGAAQNSQDLLNSLFGSQSNLQNQLANGGAYGNSQQYIDQLMNSMGQRSNMGSMYESIVGGSGNTYVDPLIDQMRKDSANNLATLQNANSLDATAAGQSGSSRQAMQNAMLGSQVNNQLATNEAQLRQQNYDNDLAMKMGIAQQADSNRQNDQNSLINLINGSQNSMNSAAGMGTLLQSLANGGIDNWLKAQQGSWNPLNNIANIIGSPTILGNSSGSSKSKGAGASGSIWG